MIVLGIDPGSRHVGWALLDVEASGARYVEAGHIEIDALDRARVRRLVSDVRATAARTSLVCVERIDGVNARGGPGWATMATGLVLTQGVGQRLAQALEDDGRRVVEATAEAWHRHFFDARAVDAQAVKALVWQLVVGWPATSNGHARDAAAVALYAPIAARVTA